MSESNLDFGPVVAVLPADGWEFLNMDKSPNGFYVEPIIGWSVNAKEQVRPIAVSNAYGSIYVAGTALRRRGDPTVYSGYGHDDLTMHSNAEAWLTAMRAEMQANKAA